MTYLIFAIARLIHAIQQAISGINPDEARLYILRALKYGPKNRLEIIDEVNRLTSGRILLSRNSCSVYLVDLLLQRKIEAFISSDPMGGRRDAYFRLKGVRKRRRSTKRFTGHIPGFNPRPTQPFPV